MNVLGLGVRKEALKNSILWRKEEINMDFFGVNRIDG